MPFNVTYARFKSFVNGGSLLPADLNAIQDDLGNQLADVNVAGGFNEGVNVRRGKFIQPAAGTRANVVYGALSNGPDEVPNLVLPSDGFIVVAFQALWASTVIPGSNAAIFLNSNQLKSADGTSGGAPAVAETSFSVSTPVNTFAQLVTRAQTGLSGNTVASTDQTEVTTGQLWGGALGATGYGGFAVIFAAAGTYTVSVQYKSTGTVTVKNRKLLAHSEAY